MLSQKIFEFSVTCFKKGENDNHQCITSRMMEELRQQFFISTEHFSNKKIAGIGSETKILSKYDGKHQKSYTEIHSFLVQPSMQGVLLREENFK